MNLGRYDDSTPSAAKLKTAIHKAELLLGTLKAVQEGSVPARRTLVDIAREELYEGPVIRFRVDDLFDSHVPTREDLRAALAADGLAELHGTHRPGDHADAAPPRSCQSSSE